MACHNGSNPHIPKLTSYNEVMKVAQIDTGMDIFTLVRVSRIHLFGITSIFFITSLIFCHAYVRPLWLKCTIIAPPFIAIIADIFSWYLTKIFPPFAWVVMTSGALMGVAFGAQLIISLWQMWFFNVPDDIMENEGRLPCIGKSCDTE